uniref:NADH-ubiquinone oxidoreductase chain 6 n=1 Tax=Trypetoptera punctulata TaxID=305554 RepID=A0A6B9RC00_TRYPU|nr:NADH dehydrogenase subunit 6 [Trypetoptera punctulata]
MFQLGFMVFSIAFATVFMQMNHPLAMGMILLLQTILICLITSQLIETFWFSYILFLIFLGGMLVLFIYVISLASNEMFTTSLKTTLTFSFFVTALGFISFLFVNHFTPLEMNTETELVTIFHSSSLENNLVLAKLYSFPSSMITIFLVNYLLITLIATVKITNLFYGPLRKTF